MKIDEVINNLEKIKNQYGNLDVKCLKARICWSTGACLGTCVGDVDTVIATTNGKCVIIEGKYIEE